MSSLVQKFTNRVLPILLGASTAFAAANANAEMALTCHVSPEAIKAAQDKILTTEGMVPVVSYHLNVGDDKAPKYAKAAVMMNPATGKGYLWGRMPAGNVCVLKSYSNIQLFANNRLDPAAFIDPKTAPSADLTGNGKHLSTMGMNVAIFASSKQSEFPMYRATVEDMFTGGNNKMIARYTEVLVGNPNTGEGTVLASRPNGTMISEYIRVVATPKRDGVPFGAIYSKEGKELLGQSIAMAPVVNPVAFAQLDKK